MTAHTLSSHHRTHTMHRATEENQEKKWIVLTALFALLGSIAFGAIEFTAISRIFPQWGIWVAFVFGVSGVVTEILVFWQSVKWAFITFFKTGYRQELEIYLNATHAAPRERYWKAFFLDGALFFSMMIAIGFYAITVTHATNALIAFGVAASTASPIAWGLGFFAAIAYGMFFYRITNEWVKKNIFRQIRDKFIEHFIPDHHGWTVLFIIKASLKALTLLLITTINIYGSITAVDTWMNSGYSFFSFLKQADLISLLSYVIIGACMTPLYLISSIEYGVKSIANLLELMKPSQAPRKSRHFKSMLSDFFFTGFSAIMFALHIFAEGAVSAEGSPNATMKFIDTIAGAGAELFFDFHFVIELIKGKSDHKHEDCHHDHDLGRAIKNSFGYISALLCPCCFRSSPIVTEEEEEENEHDHSVAAQPTTATTTDFTLGSCTSHDSSSQYQTIPK